MSSGDKQQHYERGRDHTVSSGDKHSIMREDAITQCLQEINTALWEEERDHTVSSGDKHAL